MDHIEDEYKKRFKDKELPNDNFDADGLWDAIDEVLDEKETPVNGFPHRKKWTFPILLLLMIATALFFLHDNNEDQATQDTALVSTPSESTVKKDGSNSLASIEVESAGQEGSLSPGNHHQKEELAETVHANTPLLHTTDQSENNRPTNSSSIAETPENSTRNEVSESTLAKSNSKLNSSEEKVDGNFADETRERLIEEKGKTNAFQKGDVNSAKTTTSEIAEEPTATDVSAQLNEQTNQPSNDTKGPENHNQIAWQATNNEAEEMVVSLESNRFSDEATELLPTPVKYLEQKEFPFEKEVKSNHENTAPETKRSKNISYLVGFSGGLNYASHKFNFTNDPADWELQKNNTEAGSTGMSYNFNASLVWRNKWLLRSGLEYHQLWSKLDYQTMTDTFITKENVVLKVLVDSMGNVVNEIRGDTSLHAVITRTVVHHNKYTVFRIPLEIGFIKRKNNWVYGLNVGSVFNFRINQNGKTFSPENEIVNFDNNSLPAIYETFNISFRASPFLAYKIKNNLMLSFEPQWTWQTNNIFEDENIQVTSQQFNLNLGFQMAF